MALEIWLLRHGQTTGNVKRIIQGWTIGELTDKGHRQAILTGVKLRGVHFDEIHVSSSFRAKQTANGVCMFRENKDVMINDLLREKSGGDWDGKPLTTYDDAIEESGTPRRIFAAPNGECQLDVYNRAKEYVRSILEETKTDAVDILEDVRTQVGAGKEVTSDPHENELKATPELDQTTWHTIQEQQADLKKIDEETGTILKEKCEPWEIQHPHFKRILIVTHGGYIAEFENVMKEMNGEEMTKASHPYNTSAYVFGIIPNPDAENEEDAMKRYKTERLLINHKFDDEWKITPPEKKKTGPKKPAANWTGL